MAKSIQRECPECGEIYSIVTRNPESIQFCPFCGDGGILPYDDLDDENFGDELDDEDDESFED